MNILIVFLKSQPDAIGILSALRALEVVSVPYRAEHRWASAGAIHSELVRRRVARHTLHRLMISAYTA